MTITERMLLTMKEKKLKATDLADTLEIGKSSISTWKSRNTNPPSEYIVQICEFLDVSLEFLLTGKSEAMQAASPELSFADNCILPLGIDLTDDERELLGMYGYLSKEGKKWAQYIIKGYLKDNENLSSSRQLGTKHESGRTA